MHHATKKAAVAKYSEHKDLSVEELKELIASDEKGYTPEEVEEIYTAVTGGEVPPKQTPSKKEEPVDENPFRKKHYQEWRVEIVNGKAEKLKVIRERVLITQDQAENLNRGVIEGPDNKYASMYFLA